MKRSLLVALLLGLAVVVLSTPVSRAQGSGTPTGGGQCLINGKYVFVPSGGCPGGGGNHRANHSNDDADAAAAAAAAAEAERQRQEDLKHKLEVEGDRLSEIEATKESQAEFLRKKQQDMEGMKGISGDMFGLNDDGSGDGGLKGPGDTDTDSTGLKGTGDTGTGLRDAPNSSPPPGATPARPPYCKWGDQGTAVVDLRCLGLDPDKPIVLDPHVVRGQERAFPAQIDPATFQNANYNKGYEALMRTTFSVKDATDAVAYFKAAQLQRPNDPMVRNGLLLAQDILKGRQQKEQEDKDRAMQSLYLGLAALVTGDPATASDSVRRASQLDPGNPIIAPWNLALTEMSAVFKAPGQDIKPVKELVGSALLSEFFGDYAMEVRELEIAKSIGPESLYVDMSLDRARRLAQEFPVHNVAHPAPR